MPQLFICRLRDIQWPRIKRPQKEKEMSEKKSIGCADGFHYKCEHSQPQESVVAFTPEEREAVKDLLDAAIKHTENTPYAELYVKEARQRDALRSARGKLG